MEYFDNYELSQLQEAVNYGAFWEPRIVKLTLLDRCNWRCQMCRCDKTAPPILNAVKWIEIASQVIKLGAKELGFTGGEPTLHPEFEDILKGIRRIDPNGQVRLKLLTNGVNLTAKRAERYIDLGIRRFIVSVHGASERTHDSIVGVRNQWNRTTAGLKVLTELRSQKTHTAWVNYVVSRANLYELPDMVDLVADLGCEGLSLSPLDGRVEDSGHAPLTAAEMVEARSKIFPQVRNKAKNRGLKLFPADAEIFGADEDSITDMAIGRLSRGFYVNKPCYWTFYHLTVTPDGTVQPCCNRPLQNGYGNLMKFSLEEVLAGTQVSRFLKYAACGPGKFSACNSCEMKLQVNGWIHSRLSNNYELIQGV